MPSFPAVPPLLVAFVVTVLFSFVLGLELHGYRRASGQGLGFGTTRTLTLIGATGFVLDVLGGLPADAVGFVLLGAWLTLYYGFQLREGHEHLLLPLIAMMTFLIGPIARHEAFWFLVLYVVVVILMLGAKPGIRRFSDALRSSEALTLAKFLIMAGLILPILPGRQIAPFISVTWYQVWLAVILVSGISYLSYLAQTYFFPSRGVLLTGLLGGLYSSTAATVVLAKRAREDESGEGPFNSAIIMATAMMYLRLWCLIALLGSSDTALHLALPFAVVAMLSLGLGWYLYWRHPRNKPYQAEQPVHHPLEFTTALVFAFLFVFFAAVTSLVIGRFGTHGLNWMSFLVGFTDIDPFILSLLAGKFHVGANAIEAAVIIASGANNLLKGCYAAALARRLSMLPAVAWLFATFAFSMLWVIWGMR